MKIAGVIAEYNPFHSGHLRHLQARRMPQKRADLRALS